MYKVLFISGSVPSSKRIASAITQSGFEVIIASSESERLKMADEASPDAIVVSDSPPKLNGFKLCQPLRRIFNLPLILLGDKPEAEVYPPTFKAAADWDYYMCLPINHEELAARIKVLLWRYRRQVSRELNDSPKYVTQGSIHNIPGKNRKLRTEFLRIMNEV